MYTAIRLDDITPDMNLEKFNRIKTILDTYQIKPLIGVVPFNKDNNLHQDSNMENFPDFIQNLKDAGWVIALHGYEHVYATKKGGLFPLNHFSEFAGVSYEQQYQMIKEGKEQLQSWGTETDIFMAPAHSYDKNTLKALKECGFTKITDGFGKYPYKRAGLIFYPIASRKSNCFKDTEGYTTLVIHANSIEDDEFSQYESLIKDNVKHFISYEDYLKVNAKSRLFFGSILEYGMASVKHFLVSIR